MMEALRIPGTDIFDAALSKSTNAISRIADAFERFDGTAFDANRALRAARWQGIFQRAGIPLSPAVNALAASKSTSVAP